jgi:hypothetical protein
MRDKRQGASSKSSLAAFTAATRHQKSVETTESHFVENRHNSDESDNGVDCSHWSVHSLSVICPFRAFPAKVADFCGSEMRPNKSVAGQCLTASFLSSHLAVH